MGDDLIKVEPGVYPNVDFDEYAAWDAVNHSTLVHFSKTPAHAYYASLHQRDTPALGLGHLVHQVILEPERLAADYLVAPKVDRRTKAGKLEWAKFEERAEGRIIVTKEDMETAKILLHNCQSHQSIREMLRSKGANEPSLVWYEEEFDTLCKARLDRVCEFQGQGYITDLKTHGFPASRHSFESAIHKFGYHTAAAWYLRGVEKTMPLPDDAPERRFAWIVLETKEPNLVRLFDADDEALRIGMDDVMKYLAQYAECKARGVWPGWDEGMEIAGLPAWAMKRFEG